MSTSKAVQLKGFFNRNGYYRIPDEKLREKLKAGYKKGYEVRLVAMDYKEYLSIRKLLKELGYLPGKAYSKGNRRIVPLYGRENYEGFKALMNKTKMS
ncbi:MAG: hypothetical protein ACRDE2_04125 [Chitinophagaceae bacterium]